MQRNVDPSLIPIHCTYPPLSEWDGGEGGVHQEVHRSPSVLCWTEDGIAGVLCVYGGGGGVKIIAMTVKMGNLYSRTLTVMFLPFLCIFFF